MSFNFFQKETQITTHNLIFLMAEAIVMGCTSTADVKRFVEKHLPINQLISPNARCEKSASYARIYYNMNDAFYVAKHKKEDLIKKKEDELLVEKRNFRKIFSRAPNIRF